MNSIPKGSTGPSHTLFGMPSIASWISAYNAFAICCAELGPARALVNGPQRPVSRFSTRLRADELDEHAVELSRPDIDWDGELAAIMKGEQDHVARPRGKN